MQHTVSAVLKGNIEAIEQCLSLIESISTEGYTRMDSTIVGSSIGVHFRHILDIYRAITHIFDSEIKLIDYDVRRRDHLCETQPDIAREEFAMLRHRLKTLTAEQLLAPVKVKTEVTLKETESATLSSTLLRELVFASSHAVHHLAIISIVAKLLHLDVDSNLGIAPATATFNRTQRR